MEHDPHELPPPENKPPIPPVLPPQIPPPLPSAHSQVTRVQPGKAAPRDAGLRILRRPVVRTPRLWVLIALLCLRPETWAESARYRMRTMVRCVIVIILLTALALGIAAARNGINWLQNFAATYDQHYSALAFADGTLTALDPKRPLPSGIVPFGAGSGSGAGVPFRVDLNPHADTNDTVGCKITQRELILQFQVAAYGMPLSRLFSILDPHDETGVTARPIRIDGAYLQGLIADNYGSLIVWFVFVVAATWTLASAIWAALIAFLVIPFIQIAAHGLGMSRRIAFKMALGICVPLILLDAVLRICNISLTESVGLNIANLVWGGLATMMAIWAGLLANQMYRAKRTVNRGRGM